MEYIQQKWEPVQTYLLNEGHLVGKFFKVFGDGGFPKPVVLNVFLGLLALLLIVSDAREQMVISALICVPLPLSRTWSAMVPAADDLDEMGKWLMYWLIYICFEFLEPFCFLIPFYALLKTSFSICLFLPPIDWRTPLYIEWMKPFIYAWNGKINRDVLKLANPLLLKEMNLDAEKIQTMTDDELKKRMKLFTPLDLVLDMYTFYFPSAATEKNQLQSNVTESLQVASTTAPVLAPVGIPFVAASTGSTPALGLSAAGSTAFVQRPPK